MSRYIQFHIRIVGAHSHAVERIGVMKPHALVGYRHSQNTAGHGNADGNGEGADNQGEEELYTADCYRADCAEKKPACGILWERAVKAGESAADIVQEKDPQVSEHRHKYGL